ncbi:MAG TPA: hypothetical protein VFV19_04795 [Candidatus Polarisedimenticolaceae bacterium]|nr:hypothetical protein [Candidatus Polarisedimenticolaceae bacterium]
MRGRVASAIVLVVTAGCAAPKSEAQRTVTDPDRGIRYVVPQGWKNLDAEIRSPEGTLLTVRVYDLVEAKKDWVASLPDSLIPQLTGWTTYYYILNGDYTRQPSTIAGLPATEFNYPIRVRAQGPPSKVTYWVVQRKQRLFVLRAAYPAEGLAKDEPVVRDIVEHWSFLDSPPNG